MISKMNTTSAGYISPNDLGYVDLPREAVLNNTVSPSEKRAFATIAAIPLAIPAALFATEATLLAGFLALVGCGSPGEAEDPILTSFSDAGHGEISPDAGTTDEGDGLVTTDDGMTDTGDTLVAADDGGMSGPDEGVTIADDGDVLATADDGTTVVDVLPPPEDGVQDLSDTSEVKDGPDVVDSGDGLNATDDGAPIVDVVIPSDVAIPEDGVQDLSDASEVKDVPDVVDNSDELIAADDEVADSSDIAPPPDDSADQGETAIGTDTAADTAQPCSPSCTPVAETVTCEDGTTNVAVNYFVKCATQFVCDGIGTSLVSVNLPDPTTQSTQSVTVNKCVSDILFGGCQAINGELSEYCGAVKIEMKPKPKPNIPPTVNQLVSPADKSLGILPAGDQCFNAANSIGFSFTASDKDNDALTCGLKIYQNGVLAPAATVSATFNDLTKPLTLQLSANLLQPRTDYCWNVSCNDGKVGDTVADASQCFTTSEKGLIGWWRFDEEQGNIAKDSSGNGRDGNLIGFDTKTAWQGGSLYFSNIGSHYITVSNDPYQEIASLQFEAIVNVKTQQNSVQTIINKMGDKTTQLIQVEVQPNKILSFVACTPNMTCAFIYSAQSLQPLDDQYHKLSGIFNGASILLSIDNNPQKSANNPPGVVPTPQPFIFGEWAAGINNISPKRPFTGYMDSIALWNYNKVCK